LLDTTYLDHAGTTIYAKSLVDQFARDMTTNLFGNPHSRSPSSELSTQRVDRVRLRVLQFFKANPEDFDIIFVANATAGIKMVMDAFTQCSRNPVSHTQDSSHPFWYGYHRDSHTSLVGMREVASRGSRCFEADQEVEDWISGSLKTDLDQPGSEPQLGLFAYPAQSNMNGRRLPLDWPGRLRESPLLGHRNVYTLLDAAAYVSTAQLDLSNARTAPDFTVLSLYKIFGFPDLGALIVRKNSGHILERRRYFGGGTVDMVICMKDKWHAKKVERLHEKMEDGTLPFHHIIAVDSALDVHERLYGSMDRISRHTCSLAKQLYDGLSSLRHANGKAVCIIYKDPASQFGNSKTQAPTIAFNVQNSRGGWVGKTDFERLADLHGIQLRTGGVCNPGGIASSLNLAGWELRRNFMEGTRCGNDLDVLGGKPTGVVRVSLGAMTTYQEIYHFLQFVSTTFVDNRHRFGDLITPGLSLEPPALQRVDSLRIAPIVDCAAWEIPAETAWEVRSTGLAWDREWCLVSEKTGAPLTAREYPSMKRLKSSVHMQEGVLKVKAQLGWDDESELAVSLWDIPSAACEVKATQPASDSNGELPIATPYTSKAISDFFTAAIGIPCTLARFPADSFPQAAEGFFKRSLLAPSRRSIVIATKSNLDTDPQLDLTGVNIVVSAPKKGYSRGRDDWRYLQMGEQFFRVLDGDQVTQINRLQEPFGPFIPASTTIKHLHTLPNPATPCPASQNPTITLHDPIRLFTAPNPSLHSCLDSQATFAVSGFRCPVPRCEKVVQDLEEHLRGHVHVEGFESETESVVTKDKESMMKADGGRRDGRKRVRWISRVVVRLKSLACLS
jgi:molybdenum cofactor sulfurtransferase